MKRYDLRELKENFYDRFLHIMKDEIAQDDVAIFIFEIGDFSAIQKVANLVKESNYTLMNSLKYNESDWTIVVKKQKDENLQNKEENIKEEE